MLISIMAVLICISCRIVESFSPSHILQYLLLNGGHYDWHKMSDNVVICIYLMNKILNIFAHILIICINFQNCLFKSFAHFFLIFHEVATGNAIESGPPKPFDVPISPQLVLSVEHRATGFHISLADYPACFCLICFYLSFLPSRMEMFTL